MIEFQVLNGDCRDVLKSLADGSVDSIVTDPPYELGFMGKAWDATGIAYDQRVWTECLRVLKPGGHLLAFGGSRTYHRMACAIEDAGFEIRDQIMWVYGSGFPKSLDVSKAIDRAAGVQREIVTETVETVFGMENDKLERPAYGIGQNGAAFNGHAEGATATITIPATPEAEQWQGWGTALKPAHEPIVLARKPLVGTVAANVLQHGTGALNIDGCRVGTEQTVTTLKDLSQAHGNNFGASGIEYPKVGEKLNPPGRWPANFIHDGSDQITDLMGEAARFFYCAKASKADRNEGLDGFEEQQQDSSRKDGNPGGDNPRNRGLNRRANHHPTVKPTALMRYLVRLVTPPNGIVVDPFTGSGSTGKAAVIEGFSFIGIEQDPDYAAIATARITHALNTREETLFND